ncbi:hypothetical protein [Bosea sp. BK604]|uniref:hypothetical protein n=1 Tax=Bosea sp. BK604 TaxID=2512180 RepID=UPI0010503595|nr:hypothetical protein [Bosea sp. BK604]
MAERLCLVCDHIFHNTRPICHVVFLEGGDIQVDCGEDDHGDDENFYKSFRPVGLNHLIDRDEDIADLLLHEAPGFSFGREAPGHAWTRYYI